MRELNIYDTKQAILTNTAINSNPKVSAIHKSLFCQFFEFLLDNTHFSLISQSSWDEWVEITVRMGKFCDKKPCSLANNAVKVNSIIFEIAKDRHNLGGENRKPGVEI